MRHLQNPWPFLGDACSKWRRSGAERGPGPLGPSTDGTDGLRRHLHLQRAGRESSSERCGPRWPPPGAHLRPGRGEAFRRSVIQGDNHRPALRDTKAPEAPTPPPLRGLEHGRVSRRAVTAQREPSPRRSTSPPSRTRGSTGPTGRSSAALPGALFQAGARPRRPSDPAGRPPRWEEVWPAPAEGRDLRARGRDRR